MLVNFYTKTETDTLLTGKVSNIGDISLPGMLDICTSGYTNSRIRCNAELNGYTGYAELSAYPSCDMHLNLSTARTDGGWMYFKINNDDYIQLPGSDNKVNVYKGAAISRNVDVGKVLTLKRIPGVSDTTPLVIISDSPGGATVATHTSTASNQGCFSFWTTAASTASWMTCVMWGGSNEFVIKTGSNGLTLKPTGDTSIGGNLDAGTTQAQTSIKAYVNHAGYQGNIQIEPGWRSQGFIYFHTNYSEGLLSFVVKYDVYMYVGIEVVYFYKPTTNAPDDILKENEELIEHACETLSKLRPQLYDKKPDMENDDPTTWYKESGLIAQEIYYDAPGLRHLIHKGKPELDEEGNTIPSPEIPTPIDPQQDPDYSSWGKDPASVSYIGLTSYLVKAGTELHERVSIRAEIEIKKIL